MSLLISTSQQICHSPTNQSKAKMLYSFPKSSRFPKDKENLCDQFYELADTMKKRTTTLGYGNKYDFTKDSPKTPAPGSYQNSLEKQKKKNKGFCFGSGRGQMQTTGIIAINTNPGPGTYESISNKSKISYSLKAKLKTDNREKYYVPGPGSYQNTTTLNLDGKNFCSKYKTKFSCKFGHQKKLKVKNTKVPGPGTYNTSKTDLSPNGKYTLSKMANSQSRTFSKDSKKGFQNRSPGPGNYQLPSEFGHYLDKNYVYNSIK